MQIFPRQVYKKSRWIVSCLEKNDFRWKRDWIRQRAVGEQWLCLRDEQVKVRAGGKEAGGQGLREKLFHLSIWMFSSQGDWLNYCLALCSCPCAHRTHSPTWMNLPGDSKSFMIRPPPAFLIQLLKWDHETTFWRYLKDIHESKMHIGLEEGGWTTKRTGMKMRQMPTLKEIDSQQWGQDICCLSSWLEHSL